MVWKHFLLATFLAGAVSSITDWFFSGILFHEKCFAYPEVSRQTGGKSETPAVAGSIVFTNGRASIKRRLWELEGWIRQPLLELDIEGGDHIAHDGVKAAKHDELDDARIAVGVDEPLLHLCRD